MDDRQGVTGQQGASSEQSVSSQQTPQNAETNSAQSGIQPDEFGLIRRLTRRLPETPTHVKVGIGDDAAVLSAEPGMDILISTDAMVDGVHFARETMSFADVGYKAMTSSISDIAAMGGIPKSAVIALAVPRDFEISLLDDLYDGIADAAKTYACPLVGGDVVSTAGPLVVTSTVTGEVPTGQALRRSGARPGDIVFVTGSVGASGAGLAFLQRLAKGDAISRLLGVDDARQLVRSHQRPIPQVEAGQILRIEGAASCNDITDGLASELNEIAEASGVRLRIDAARVPIAPAVKNWARLIGADALQFAWTGGEDYQLVGTIAPFGFARALARCESVGIVLTQIGRVEMGDGVVVVAPDGRLDILCAQGYNHFGNQTD